MNRIKKITVLTGLFLAISGAYFAAWLHSNYIFLKVKENSMRPGLCPGDILFVEVIRNPEEEDYKQHVGDKLIFATKENRAAVKRLYAAPLQRVTYTLNRIEAESYNSLGVSTCMSGTNTRNDSDSLVVGRNELFLAGDNLSISTDSRAFGPVPTSTVIGKVKATMSLRLHPCSCTNE